MEYWKPGEDFIVKTKNRLIANWIMAEIRVIVLTQLDFLIKTISIENNRGNIIRRVSISSNYE